MDVDICSPTFRAVRHFAMKASKRARSPDDHGPLERPPKRPSLAINDASSPGVGQSASTSSSRHTSEDWVRQTCGLTIDSPVLQEYVESGGPLEDAPMSQDVDMAVEPQYEDPGLSMHRPQLHLLHTTNVGINNAHHTGIQMSVQHLQPYDTSNATNNHGPIGIKLVPPTPMCMTEQPFTPPEPPPNSSPMSASPLTPNTSRKQKFTMGPRADCEKCRLGIKGHWVHLD